MKQITTLNDLSAEVLEAVLQATNAKQINFSIDFDTALEESLMRYGYFLAETSQEDPVQKIINILSSQELKEKYSKYLAVLHYFDPNSLGTLSEVLLTHTINKVYGETIAQHTGGSQGLTDLIIDGCKVSLKTTQSGKHIGLGSDINYKSIPYSLIAEKLQTIGSDYTINQVLEQVDFDARTHIESRLEAIAEKLSGNDELFLWVEKVFRKSKLVQINLHLVNFDKTSVLNKLKESIFYTSNKGWGVRDQETNAIIVLSDMSGKPLNITPNFIRSAVEEDVLNEIIKIELEIKHERNVKDIENISSTLLLNSLEQIYSAIYEN